MEAVTILAIGFLCCVCFVIGAKVGQKVSKGEEIKMPSVNPLEAVREHRAKKEAQSEQDRMDTILRNIEGYNGTPDGQEDVPRR
jgi:hypothetical protein